MITLKASEGKIYTDGVNFGTTIQLAAHRSAEEFYEITFEEYKEMLKQQEEELRKEQTEKMI